MEQLADTRGVPDEVIRSAKYNAVIDDLIAEMNLVLPAARGGSGYASMALALAAAVLLALRWLAPPSEYELRLPTGDQLSARSDVRFEVEATRLFATDLLKSGVSREWVRWLLDDMRRRGNPWPKTCAKPPAWMMSGMGVKKPVPLW
jgi:hypothetical protein